jgi:hypothetical protein
MSERLATKVDRYVDCAGVEWPTKGEAISASVQKQLIDFIEMCSNDGYGNCPERWTTRSIARLMAEHPTGLCQILKQIAKETP